MTPDPTRYYPRYSQAIMQPHNTGEYVLYNDYKAALDAANAKIARLENNARGVLEECGTSVPDTDPVFDLCVMALAWHGQAERLRTALAAHARAIEIRAGIVVGRPLTATCYFCLATAYQKTIRDIPHRPDCPVTLAREAAAGEPTKGNEDDD